jgi:Uma2 family endonuclease
MNWEGANVRRTSSAVQVRFCSNRGGPPRNGAMTLNSKAVPRLRNVHLPHRIGAEQIMVMPAHAPTHRWTEEEFYLARDEAPAGERWELVDGEVLVTPGPHWSHQDLVGELYVRLREYLRSTNVGKVYLSPLDVRLEPGLVLQPDLLAVPGGHLANANDVVSKLLLAVEVISPSSSRGDRVTKRPRYQRNRVPEYWIVDSGSQTIERWQPDDERPAVLAESLNWHPADASQPFELDIPAYFRAAAAP